MRTCILTPEIFFEGYRGGGSFCFLETGFRKRFLGTVNTRGVPVVIPDNWKCSLFYKRPHMYVGHRAPHYLFTLLHQITPDLFVFTDHAAFC